MEKIKVVHHSNQLGLGGTEKTMQLFCKHMDKNRFEVHALAPLHPVPPHRVWMDRAKALWGSNRARARLGQWEQMSSRVPEFKNLLGPERVHFYTAPTLVKILKEISPRVLHVHHSGAMEPPLENLSHVENVPALVTTNVFGVEGRGPVQERLDKILFVSRWLKEEAAPWSKNDLRCGVLYCPIEKPVEKSDLRAELGISKETFVIGRVGRNADDIHDSISLKAYQRIENDRTLFLALSPPPVMVDQARDLGIKRIRFLEPSTDAAFLSRFYNTMDVMAHARLDGETFGMVIAEAMMHGKPVVTHRTDHRNAQCELVDESCGFVAPQHNAEVYADCLTKWMAHPDLVQSLGDSARKKAMEEFEAERLTRRLEGIYEEILKAKNALPV